MGGCRCGVRTTGEGWVKKISWEEEDGRAEHKRPGGEKTGEKIAEQIKGGKRRSHATNK